MQASGTRAPAHQLDNCKETTVTHSRFCRPSLLIGIAIVSFWMAACAPRGAVPPPPPAATTDTALQVQAETAFAKGELHAALNTYQTLVQNFPQSPLVPQAFLKIGRIQTALGDDQAALGSYRQLLTAYPESLAAMDARIEMLAALQRLGRNQEIVDTAPAFADQIRGDVRLFRFYLILGDAHAALALWDQGVYFYALALTHAPPLHRPTVEEKLVAAVARLDSEQIQLLLGQFDDETVVGYLLFQQAVNMAGQSAYDDAVWHLQTFLERFPYHPYAPQARDLVAQLADKVAFDRYAVGCLLPLSGPYKLFGTRALDAIQLAFSEGSVAADGTPVKLVVKDTGSDPERAARAMQSLAEARVAAVVGPIATAEAAAEVAQARRIPILAISQREGLTDIGDNVFRNFITPRMQAAALAAYMIDTLGKRRLAVLYPDETYGRAFRDVFWDEVYRRGGEIVGLEAYDPQQTDFEEPIRKLGGRFYDTPADLQALRRPLDLLGPLSALPGYTPPEEAQEVRPGRRSRRDDEGPPPIVDFEALLVPDGPEMLGLVIPQLAYHDIVNVTLLGTNLWYSPKLLQDAGEYVQGAVFPTDFYPESRLPRVQRFVAAFEAVYGRKPGYIEAIAYDSARLLLQILRNPEVQLRAGIRHALHQGGAAAGVTGEVVFDGRGEPVKNLVLLGIDRKAFVEIERSGQPPVAAGHAGEVPPPPPPF
jgi:ABC-type branched-subunit amino acid transport system substrate-binding protein